MRSLRNYALILRMLAEIIWADRRTRPWNTWFGFLAFVVALTNIILTKNTTKAGAHDTKKDNSRSGNSQTQLKTTCTNVAIKYTYNWIQRTLMTQANSNTTAQHPLAKQATATKDSTDLRTSKLQLKAVPTNKKLQPQTQLKFARLTINSTQNTL